MPEIPALHTWLHAGVRAMGIAAFLVSGLLFAGGPTHACAKSLHPDYQLMRGDVQRYGDWLAGCDNEATCTLIGFPDPIIAVDGDVIDPPRVEMGLRMTLKGPIVASPEIVVFPIAKRVGQEGSPEPRDATSEPNAFRLRFPDGRAGQVHALRTVELDTEEAAQVVSSLTQGRGFAGVAPASNRVVVRFPQHEFSRAYKAVQSRRADLIAEREARKIDDLPGELPDGTTMPAASGLLRRLTAIPQMVSGFVPILASAACGTGRMTDVRRFRFRGGPELWSHSCSNAPSPTKSYWYMAKQLVDKPVPLALPEPRDRTIRAGLDGLDNAMFDFDFGILRSYRYEPGQREDCGTFRAWAFTTSGWHLIERRDMPLCKGLDTPEWIGTFRQESERDTGAAFRCGYRASPIEPE